MRHRFETFGPCSTSGRTEKGSIDSTIINGKGTFKLKISPKLTSEQQNKQRFRVRIEAVGLCGTYTLPFRVMTKIDRKMSRSQAASTLASLAGDVPAHQASMVQLMLEHDESIQALRVQNHAALEELHNLREIEWRGIWRMVHNSTVVGSGVLGVICLVWIGVRPRACTQIPFLNLPVSVFM